MEHSWYRVPHDGGDDVWVGRWRRLIYAYSGSLYDLPSGNVGKDFVGVLAEEIKLVSERAFCSVECCCSEIAW